MKKLLIVVDMQNDFITGSLGTAEAQKITEPVIRRIESFDGDVVFTLDTHTENYLNTREGRNLPVIHCVKGTPGWELQKDIKKLAAGHRCFEKPTFGSTELAEYVREKGYDSIELIGLCTDICVISNAMLIKAYLPEAEIKVDSSCCAGVTPESHSNALGAMKMCHITIQ